ncbi:MAG TPA: NYN domain-containing protein [Pyrinomonadaceae bacterium]|nr:NYN domain-containing protein [Pyrinomonadaceae bacterium]
MHFDPTNNISWQLGYRGRVAVFIDGNNLFHAARFHNIDIDYNKLLRVLLGDGRLLRAFFYTGVDVGAERQQGFLLWMRRNGFRVVQKELKTFYDGTRKANLDVEIAVDMLSLAGRYDTAVLVSGDEDFVYAVNAVAYKGCRVEVAGFRSNTAPKLIDVADYFIDLGEIADRVRKESAHAGRYYDHHHDEHHPQPSYSQQNSHNNQHASHQHNNHEGTRNGSTAQRQTPSAPAPLDARSAQADERDETLEDAAARAAADARAEDGLDRLNTAPGFIRVTDDQ